MLTSKESKKNPVDLLKKSVWSESTLKTALRVSLESLHLSRRYTHTQVCTHSWYTLFSQELLVHCVHTHPLHTWTSQTVLTHSWYTHHITHTSTSQSHTQTHTAGSYWFLVCLTGSCMKLTKGHFRAETCCNFCIFSDSDRRRGLSSEGGAIQILLIIMYFTVRLALQWFPLYKKLAWFF